MASSTASLPVFRKVTRSRPGGRMLPSASQPRLSSSLSAPVAACVSRRSWALMAAVNTGCRWPSTQHQVPDNRSRCRRPLRSSTQHPWPPTRCRPSKGWVRSSSGIPASTPGGQAYQRHGNLNEAAKTGPGFPLPGPGAGPLHDRQGRRYPESRSVEVNPSGRDPAEPVSTRGRCPRSGAGGLSPLAPKTRQDATAAGPVER
jgi:hypothetical protein